MKSIDNIKSLSSIDLEKLAQAIEADAARSSQGQRLRDGCAVRHALEH